MKHQCNWGWEMLWQQIFLFKKNWKWKTIKIDKSNIIPLCSMAYTYDLLIIRNIILLLCGSLVIHSLYCSAMLIFHLNSSCNYSTTPPSISNFLIVMIVQSFIQCSYINLTQWTTSNGDISFILRPLSTKKGALTSSPYNKSINLH